MTWTRLRTSFQSVASNDSTERAFTHIEVLDHDAGFCCESIVLSLRSPCRDRTGSTDLLSGSAHEIPGLAAQSILRDFRLCFERSLASAVMRFLTAPPTLNRPSCASWVGLGRVASKQGEEFGVHNTGVAEQGLVLPSALCSASCSTLIGLQIVCNDMGCSCESGAAQLELPLHGRGPEDSVESALIAGGHILVAGGTLQGVAGLASIVRALPVAVVASVRIAKSVMLTLSCKGVV